MSWPARTLFMNSIRPRRRRRSATACADRVRGGPHRGHLQAAALIVGLLLRNHRQVGALQARPLHLEVATTEGSRRRRSGVEQLADEAGRVGRAVHLPVARPGSSAPRRCRRPACASSSALPFGDDPAAVQDQDPVGELLRLVQVVGGEQDRGVLQVATAGAPGRGTRAGRPGRSRRSARPGTAVRAGRRCRSPRPAGGADRRTATRSSCSGARSGRRSRSARRSGRAVAGRRWRRAVERAEVIEQLPHPPATVIAPGLQDDADPGPPRLVGGAPGSTPSTATVAGRRHPEALEDLDRGGLAGAVRAEQHQHLAAADGEARRRRSTSLVPYRMRRSATSIAPCVQRVDAM